MLEFSVNFDAPLAIRYPRGQAYRGLEEFRAPVEYGKAEMLYEESEIALFALGSMVSTGEHVREKLKEKAGKGLYVALLLFVGIPLPGTGAWTGTLAASFLDMDFKKSVLACMGGVLLAGVIMATLSILGVSAFSAAF